MLSSLSFLSQHYQTNVKTMMKTVASKSAKLDSSGNSLLGPRQRKKNSVCPVNGTIFDLVCLRPCCEAPTICGYCSLRPQGIYIWETLFMLWRWNIWKNMPRRKNLVGIVVWWNDGTHLRCSLFWYEVRRLDDCCSKWRVLEQPALSNYVIYET